MSKNVRQIYPEFGKSRHTVLSPEQFDEAEASGALIDQAIITSAEKLVSKVCTQIDLYRPDFTTISHVRNESVTLVARLIEWPLIQELKNVKVFDFILMPIVMYAISLIIMFTFDNAEGFLIITILRDAYLMEEIEFFKNVAKKKRQLYKLLLNGLDINFSFIAGDAWISEVFFETLKKWANHQSPAWGKVSFVFRSMFFISCNALAKIIFDLIHADKYEIFEGHETAKEVVMYTIPTVLGLLPIIPRLIAFFVVIGEIKYTGMRWNQSLRRKPSQFMNKFFTGYVYDFLEIDPDYELRLHKNYRSLGDLRTALLLKTVSKTPQCIDIRVQQLALALMFENVPVRYQKYSKKGRCPKSLRGASVFWFSSCYIADSAFFGNLLPDHMTDREAVGLSFMKNHEIELSTRMLEKQDETVGRNRRSFPESVLCYMLAKIRLNSVLNADFMHVIRSEMRDNLIPRNASLDRIWLGLAAHDLVKLRTQPWQIEQFLFQNFERSLLRGERTIQLDKLPKSSEKSSIFNEILNKTNWNLAQKANSSEDLVKKIGSSSGQNLSSISALSLIGKYSKPMELYAIFYVVKVSANPEPGDYGSLLSKEQFSRSILINAQVAKLIVKPIKEFLLANMNRGLVEISWSEFYERQIKHKYELFDGQFCVASLIDVGTDDIQNGGLILFWQKELLEKTDYCYLNEFYLTCQVTTSFPLAKQDYIIYSERIVSQKVEEIPQKPDETEKPPDFTDGQAKSPELQKSKFKEEKPASSESTEDIQKDGNKGLEISELGFESR